MSDLTGIEQLPQPDPRGWLAMRYLPPDLQNAEDSTAAADRELLMYGIRRNGFQRDATTAEKTLLEHIGYELPEELKTTVTFVTETVRNRRWPQLETQEVTP